MVVSEMSKCSRVLSAKRYVEHQFVARGLPGQGELADRAGLMNLAVNARDAMKNGGTLEIKTVFFRGQDVHAIPAARPLVTSPSTTGSGLSDGLKTTSSSRSCH